MAKKRLTQCRDFGLVHGASWDRFTDIAQDMVLSYSAAWEKLVGGVLLSSKCGWSKDRLPRRGLRTIKIRVTPETYDRMRTIAKRWKIPVWYSMAAILETYRKELRQTIRRGLTNPGEKPEGARDADHP